MDNFVTNGGRIMKTKKDVCSKNADKKIAKRKGFVLQSQIKAGGFWEDMRALYGMKSS
jgi:hypothetical protein